MAEVSEQTFAAIESRAWLYVRPVFFGRNMLSELEKKVARFVEQHELLGSAARVALALSGGADSTALLYVMQALKGEGIFGAELFCAHVNHQLRGQEADLDEAFVLTQAAAMNVPAVARRVDVRGFARRNKLSIETAARQLRMAALAEIARENHCDLIATAHQKNDNAETLVQRLSRGTAFRGLGGISPMRVFPDAVPFVRPLLMVTRHEILEYLRERNVPWRQDRTNADCTYRRNYIRHQLLPALQRGCKGNIVEQLSELAQRAYSLQNLISHRADQLWPEVADCTGEQVTLDAKRFAAKPPALQIELVRRSLTGIGSGEQRITLRHYEGILRLAQRDVTAGQIELPGGFIVRREYGSLTVMRPGREAPHEQRAGGPVQLEIPGRTRFGEYVMEATVCAMDLKSEISDLKFEIQDLKSRPFGSAERFDLDKVKLPLHVRPRLAGDRFVPLGLTKEKKLGKFLTDQRVPHDVRSRVLVVSDSEKILWVWPVRISEQAKVSPDTRRLLQLRITAASENSIDADTHGQ